MLKRAILTTALVVIPGSLIAGILFLAAKQYIARRHQPTLPEIRGL